jgi:hypothetical protein
MKWKDILKNIEMEEGCFFKNICGIFEEMYQEKELENIQDKILKKGCFLSPFCYYFIWMLSNTMDLPIQNRLKIFLEKCLEKSFQYSSNIGGNIICLSDNSGSTRDLIFCYGRGFKINEISNLSSLFMSKSCHGKGQVGLFGSNLVVVDIEKKDALLGKNTLLEKIISDQKIQIFGDGNNLRKVFLASSISLLSVVVMI